LHIQGQGWRTERLPQLNKVRGMQFAFGPGLPPAYAIALSFALAITAIAIIMAYLPRIMNTTPDSQLYIGLAKNIVANFCYSTSPVENASCVPSWGSQPPGYPLFIALVHILAGEGERPLVFAQMLLFSIAALYFCQVLYASHQSPALFMVTAGATLFSPASFGWSHFILTEFLSSAAVLLTFGEIARSVQVRRFRAWGICIAVICGMLIRWDLITLLIPVLAVLTLSFGLRALLRQGIPIVVICALPYLFLVARAAVVGLPLLPTPNAPAEITFPAGVFRFFQVAALDWRAAQNLHWPLYRLKYSKIRIDGDPECRVGMPHGSVPEYSEMASADQVCALFSRLKEVPDGRAVPKSLDDAFSKLADTVSKQWFSANIEIPTLRAIRMWTGWLGHPLPSLETGRTPPLKQIFISYYLLVGAGLLIACFAGGHFLRTIAIGALSLVVARTAFLAWITATEIRYLDPLFPTVDVISLCGLWQVLARLFSRPAGVQ
jgi:hypothetical protein